MTRDEIKEKVNDFLIHDFEIDAEKLREDARLKDDVGIDSLDYVDIVVSVKQVFGYRIPNGDLKDVVTLGQFYDYLAERV